MIKKLLIIPFIFLSITVFSQKDSTIITILHMNDLHAKIQGFPQLKHVLDSIRANSKDVFLFSAGDLFSGNPIVDRAEKKGWPIIDLMNDMQFDISAIGNHDFDYGQEVLNERMKDAHFSFLCANVKSEKAILNQPKAYEVITSSTGIEIAVICLLQVGDNGFPDSHPKNFDKIELFRPEASIKKYKKELKAYDFKLALTHLGNRADKALAENNKWLDLIVGGHTHTVLEPAQKFGNVTVTQAGSNVKYLGVSHVLFVNKKLRNIDNQLIPLENQAVDSLTFEKVKAFSEMPELHVQIADITYELNSRKEIGQLMANAYKDGLGVDIAFQNIGGVRSHKLEEGPMKLIDVMYLDPFNNEIMIFDMNKQDILSFLRYSFTVRNSPNQIISGLKADYSINNKGELTDILLTDIEGNKLDNTQVFRVAINSYMASSYDFSVKDKAQYTSIFSNDLIVDYFKKYFPIK